uniref:Potassium channel domain-containing protein n=1 Tax=Plectus sambesii TaxID=2011161 RepID=A0A914W3A9_9BILA
MPPVVIGVLSACGCQEESAPHGAGARHRKLFIPKTDDAITSFDFFALTDDDDDNNNNMNNNRRPRRLSGVGNARDDEPLVVVPVDKPKRHVGFARGSSSTSSKASRASVMSARKLMAADIERIKQPLPSDLPPEPEKTGKEKWISKVKVVLPHVLLVAATGLYTVIGAAIFAAIERPHEFRVKMENAKSVREMQFDMLRTAWNLTESAVLVSEEEWLRIVEERFDEIVDQTFLAFERFDEIVDQTFLAFEVGVRANEIFDHNTINLDWNFPSAIFFSTTVLTTIGYGHLVPVTFWGRLFCIAYALFGIPLTLITIADLAKFLSDIITDMYNYMLRVGARLCNFGCKSDSVERRSENGGILGQQQPVEQPMRGPDSESNMSELTTVSGFFVLGILLAYTAGSAVMFAAWEPDWSFLDAFYFCLITMVTVGFGDLVPNRLVPGREAYLISAICFIFVGLVLTTMCLDLIGSEAIDNVHYFGRKIGSAKDALALLQGKGRAMQNLFKRHNKKLGFSQEQAQEMWFAYMPKDIYLWRYIDQATGSSPTETARQVNEERKEDEKEADDGKEEADDEREGDETRWSPPPPLMVDS